MSKALDKALVKRVNATRSLLKEFGLRAWAYEPGVMCLDSNGETVDIDGPTWKWLEPLLTELRTLREAQGKPEGK